jgi:hypothetical protein
LHPDILLIFISALVFSVFHQNIYFFTLQYVASFFLYATYGADPMFTISPDHLQSPPPYFSPSYPDILLLENRKLQLSVVAVCELLTEMSGNVNSRDITQQMIIV